jgi:amino acid adenylation domain-containing protein
MVAQEEVRSIIEWPKYGATVDLAIPAWFEQRAAARPDDIAVVSDRSQSTYGQLDVQSNTLAHGILAAGGRQGDRVGVLMRHDVPIIVATLAILKAGRVVVILNPGDPMTRVRQVVANAGIDLILFDESNADLAAVLETGARIVGVEAAMREARLQSPGIAVMPDQLAFLIYTSGTTGEPKGVMRTHHQALQNALRMSLSVGVRVDDRIALIFAMSSEVGITLTWAGLLNGASLYPFSISEKSVTELPSWLSTQAVTVLSVTASLYRQFIKSLAEDVTLPFVRVLRFGSEEVTDQDFKAYQKHFAENSILLHSFGSSEAGIVLHRQLRHGDTVPEGALAVGRAAYGIEIVLVDENRQQVPDGEAGEIILTSTSLSDGYWNDPVLTGERFIEWPAGSGRRAFRTGDLARINSEGLLVFAGRKDMQIKIAGNRVELSDVEQALGRLSSVQQAATMATRIGDRTEITAFVVLAPGATRSAPELRRELSSLLPRYMIPAKFVFLEQIPIAPAGKVDRERLRSIQQEQQKPESGDAPRTETEKLLADFWADSLEISAVNRHDDFFELGGDSLKATVVSAWIYEALEVDIHLGTFADHPRLSELAEVIDEIRHRGSAIPLPALVRVARDAPLRLSVNQQHAWIASQTPEGLKAYTATEGRRILGALDRDVLFACMDELAARHDMLRTVFPTVDGLPAQVVHAHSTSRIPYIDLADKADATARAKQILDAEGNRVFDLTHGPLLYFSLIRIDANEHWLLSTFHHILTDPWSWDVYFRELGLLYEARLQGNKAELAPLTIQYGDFAAWQQQILQPESSAYQASLQRCLPLLSGVPRGLKLPFTRRRHHSGVDSAEGIFHWQLEPSADEFLAGLEEQSGTSYFTVRIAAFAATLAAETGQYDLVIGTYFTHRNRVALQHVFGPFVYLVPLRFRVDLTKSFREWISTTWQLVTAAEDSGFVPLDRLNAGLRLHGIEPPEVKVIFNVLKNQVNARFGGLELQKIASKMIGMPQGFHINLDQTRQVWGAAFDAGVYDPVRVRQFVERYRRLLTLAAADPDTPMEQLLKQTSRAAFSSGWRSLFGLRPAEMMPSRRVSPRPESRQ